MFGHLRLLNIACAAKAKLRVVTLTKPSREAPLAFSLLGGSEKGFRIFIENVEPGSKAAEAGLKRGDQVLLIRAWIGVTTEDGVQCSANLYTFSIGIYCDELSLRNIIQIIPFCFKGFPVFFLFFYYSVMNDSFAHMC